MSLLCLCSAHGSPGVTATALTLAATWPAHRRSLLVEADPFGGVIAARYRLDPVPGLASLAVSSRKTVDGGAVATNAQVLPGGLEVLLGPDSPDETRAVLRDIAGSVGDWAAGPTRVDVVADCGRVGLGSPVLELVARSDLNLVLVRPMADQLRVAAHLVETLRDLGASVELLQVGARPYGPGEVAQMLRVPVAGVVDWDPDAAESLTAGGSDRGFRFSLLVRSARSLAAVLADRLPGVAELDRAADADAADQLGGFGW
jgi:MinD-like ATPase involved in chromosome partitioning or flagellar assembly